jgi:uncharacterized Fe-S cluster protein YjdI
VKNAVQEYTNATIAVRFDPRVCVHSGNCVRGLRAVFDPQRRPWVNVEAANADAIAAQIDRCPSGALTYELMVRTSDDFGT